MRGQGFWVAVVAPEAYEAERLYANETIAVESHDTEPKPQDVEPRDVEPRDAEPRDAEPRDAEPREIGPRAAEPSSVPRLGDRVALIAAIDEPVLFGIGVVSAGGVRYTHRLFDDPIPVELAGAPAGLSAVAEAEFVRLTEGVAAQHRVDRDRAEWFVTVALPIEASSRAEAVREFWSYVEKLGPRELPAFVWPRGDELAMQAYLLGEETNLDPEADDED